MCLERVCEIGSEQGVQALCCVVLVVSWFCDCVMVACVQFKKGLSDFNKAIKMKPKEADGYIRRGQVYAAMDEVHVRVVSFVGDIPLL